ncbi:MAG: M20/M25/M40 family metallo-hydrolase [Thermaerobacterales bacterium]
MPDVRRLEALVQHIEDRRDEIVRLCAQLIQIPTDAPPGDTTAAVAFLADLFSREQIEYEIFEPQPGLQSICAVLRGDEPGPTLVMNGHIDQFPADDPALWTHSPYSGAVVDGRIYGRGAIDMKGGTTASLYTLLLFKRLNLLTKGTLRLMLVADEESGGQWGTDWILTQRPEWAGDACLIGEPTGLGAVRIGEKGQLWLALTASATSYHSALADGLGPVHDIAQAVIALQKSLVGRPGRAPADMQAVIEGAKQYEWFDHFKGRGWLVDHVSLNFGMIHGGIKTNVAPRECEVEVDIRIPLGVDLDETVLEVRRILAQHELNIQIRQLLHRPCPPTYTAPNHPLVTMAMDTVTSITGERPIRMFSPTFTDSRFFRIRDVPAILCGPTPYNMAGPDEYITIDDLVAVTKVHTGIALRFLAAGAVT